MGLLTLAGAQLTKFALGRRANRFADTTVVAARLCEVL